LPIQNGASDESFVHIRIAGKTDRETSKTASKREGSSKEGFGEKIKVRRKDGRFHAVIEIVPFFWNGRNVEASFTKRMLAS
jgi:hypothetical protein